MESDPSVLTHGFQSNIREANSLISRYTEQDGPEMVSPVKSPARSITTLIEDPQGDQKDD